MGNFKASNTNVLVMNADDLEVDSGTLSVDATNNRIGIGLTTPKTELTVEGTITLKEAANASSDTAAYGQLWVKSNTPCDLFFTDDSGQDIRITNDGSLAAAPGASVAADDINTGDANVSISGGSGHSLTLNATAAQAQLKTTTSGEIDITSAANIDINATTTLHMSGTAMTVTGSGAVVVDSTYGSITVGATLADGQTLKLGKNGAVETIIAPHGTAGSEAYSVTNTAGTTDGAEGQGAILLEAAAGGIGIHGADDKDIWVEAGQVVITANHNTSESIKLHADAGASQTIQIINDAGTTDGTEGAGAIDIEATVGGISLHAADDKDIAIEAGQVVITSNHNTADAIKLHADAGSSQTIKIVNDEGTDTGAEAEGAILIEAAAGGIGLHGADDKRIWAEAGQVIVTANENTADAVKIHADAGANQTITIVNDAGTGASAVGITSTAGGVTISGDTDHGVIVGNVSGGPVTIGHTTSETTVSDNLTVTGDTTMTGDLTLNGGDLAYGNGQNATLSVTSTAHNAAGKALTISAGAPTAGTTNNIAGGSVTISAGQGKGTGAGGDIVFKTANAAGGAASSLNALATALTISDDLSSTFAGAIQANSNVTFGVDDTGVDVRFFSATASEGVLYDASEDELALLLTTKLKFHDVGGGEEIFASSNGHLEINSGTTLDITAPTVDINASTAVTVDTPGVTITDSTTSSATEGGFIRLVSDDGAAMANDHRLGVIEFAGAEDASSTITVGAKIEAICDAGWSATENGTALVMSTTDANASQSEVLRLDSDKLATFAGASLFNGNATFGVDDTGVDVRLFSATASEGVLYDASEDELALLLTTKLKFHDVGGGEEIYASADGHLEVNAGTTLDMTAPTIDINASTAVTVDSDLVTFGSANANDPLVIIKNTTDDTASARLRFVKDRGAAGEDNDNIGAIEFYGDDDAQDNIEFASIGAQVADASNGAEGGRLVFRVATHDGEMQSGLTIQDGDAEDEVDVTIGNGAASLTTVAGEMKVTEDFFQGDARRIIYEEVDVRHVNAGDDTVSIEFGNKIPQDSVVTRVVALVKTASNLGTHNVQIRFDGASGRAADTDIGSSGTNSSAEALGAGATNTRSSTNVGSAVDIDLTAAKESYINDTPQFMTSADVYPYVCNAGTSNGGTDSSAGTLLVYIEYYGID